jgi:hypothetical protein
MELRQGEYRFEPPANIPGGTMIIKDAEWLECPNCHEQLLPAKLDRELEKLADKRINK